jgi:glycosyltransferase involved in cell wall biosynthesis
MNILYLTLGFYPALAWGGPVKIVHENCKELVRRGHRVTIYCTNLLNKKEKIYPKTFEKVIDGIRVVYFNAWTIPNWPGTLGPVWLPEMPQYLKKEITQFDVVHVNGYRNPMFLPIVDAARKANIPIVTQPHGMFPVIVNSFWVKRIYDWLVGKQEINGISALIAGQESEREQALSHGIPAYKISIIPNGITPWAPNSLPKSGVFRQKYGIPIHCPMILFLARINKKKGADMLVEAFVRMRNAEAYLVIAGPDDGQLAFVEDLVRKYGLEKRVVFPGLLTGSDVMAAYQDSDIYVLPCRADTFPMAIIEACTANTPMVITDRCEIAGLVKNRIAEVVPFDPQDFAEAMNRLLDDHELYVRYQANCPVMIRDTFSIIAVVDKLELLYQSVITERSKSR